METKILVTNYHDAYTAWLIDTNLLRRSPYLDRLINQLSSPSQPSSNTSIPTLTVNIALHDLFLGLTAIWLGFYPNQTIATAEHLTPIYYKSYQQIFGLLKVDERPVEMQINNAVLVNHFKDLLSEIRRYGMYIGYQTSDNQIIWFEQEIVHSMLDSYILSYIRTHKDGYNSLVVLPFTFNDARKIFTTIKLNVNVSPERFPQYQLTPPLTYSHAYQLLGFSVEDHSRIDLDQTLVPLFECMYNQGIY